MRTYEPYLFGCLFGGGVKSARELEFTNLGNDSAKFAYRGMSCKRYDERGKTMADDGCPNSEGKDFIYKPYTNDLLHHSYALNHLLQICVWN